MRLLSILLLSLSSLFIFSCNKDHGPNPSDVSHLSKIIEQRYLPSDSVTIELNLEEDGIIALEKRSDNFSIKGFRSDPRKSMNTAGWVHYRLYTFNSENQLASFSEFTSPDIAKPSVADTNIYRQGRLVQKQIKTSWMNADGMVTFPYPLWLTNRYYQYDDTNHTLTETDSVYLTHNIPKGEVVVIKTNPSFAYTVTTVKKYNDQNEITELRTTSTKSQTLSYGNGSGIFAVTSPGKIYPGTTTYTYSYNQKHQLESMNAVFTDANTRQQYESIFSYFYTN